jgi:DNA-binding NarL/FixJ family response regulator
VAERVRVFVYADDPVSQEGVAGQLRRQRQVAVVDESGVDSAAVAVVVADAVDEAAIRVVKAVQRNGCPRVVLVVARVEGGELLGAVAAGACGILRRSEARGEALARAVVAAATGDGTIPPDLLGRLLHEVGELSRRANGQGLVPTGLSNREVEVLRLVADGLGTAEIARELAYSERTVKGVIHAVTSRLQLRNRSHAVAYAMRAGLI